jgi:hypothetical protein
MTTDDLFPPNLHSPAFETERDEHLKLLVSRNLWRVESGLISIERLMQTIEAEVEIIYRNRAEAERRAVDWNKSVPRFMPADRKD